MTNYFFRVTLISLIAEGSLGAVYLAQDVPTQQKLVVKQLPLYRFSDMPTQQKDKCINSLQQEFEFLRTLRHKNLVRYLGSVKHTTSLNIIQEYVPFPTLEMVYKSYLLKKSELLVAKYTQEILHGLEFLHQWGIIHGNIKAANVFVTNDGTCKLSDYGRIGNKNQGKKANILHSPYWTAPEIILKETRHVTNMFQDIWSLGCTVYEMVATHPPWIKEKQLTLLHKIATENQPPPYPEGISAELKDFLDCCFQRDPPLRANVYELIRHPFI